MVYSVSICIQSVTETEGQSSAVHMDLRKKKKISSRSKFNTLW